MPDVGCGGKPYVVASHRHAILFNVAVPFDNRDLWNSFDSWMYPIDYFVYSASTSPPSLHRLPPCFEGGYSNPDEDKYFKPYQYNQQRFMHDPFTGILCHGDDGEFTVADLSKFNFPEGEVCLLHHHPGASSSSGKKKAPDQWRVNKVRAHRHMGTRSFSVDTVIPFRDRFLCWVDYYQGMLLLDVPLANKQDSQLQQQLQYIPLPKEALRSSSRDPDGDPDDPDRCVSITNQGDIKLVCIIRNKRSPCFVVSITAWTLSDSKGMSWFKSGTFDRYDHWRLNVCHGIPAVKPCYPMVSLVDPDVICLLLKDGTGIYWIIQVNMKSKALHSSALYIHEEEEQGYLTDMARTYFFDGYPFIPSQVCTYLNKHCTKSRELSKMMQKEKRLRLMQKKHGVEEAVMQKSGLEKAESERFAGLKMSESHA